MSEQVMVQGALLFPAFISPAPGAVVLPGWRLDVLSFVPPGAAGYRLLVCGLALLAASEAFRNLDGPLLSGVEWQVLSPAVGQVHLTYLLPAGQMLAFVVEAAGQDELCWQPGEPSGSVRVRVGPGAPDLS